MKIKDKLTAANIPYEKQMAAVQSLMPDDESGAKGETFQDSRASEEITGPSQKKRGCCP